MDIKLPHNTVLLMVAPTGSGKTTLAEHIVGQVTAQGANAVHLSSDNYRRNLLMNPDVHKHSPEMLEVSEQAFKLLFNDLAVFTSHPVNTDIVIVDTRGMDAEFRKNVGSIARKNGYNVLCCTFEFKTKVEYQEGLSDAEARITEFDVNKYRRNVLPELVKKDYDGFIRIKKRPVLDEVNVVLPDIEQDLISWVYNEVQLPVYVIGDIHECVDAWKGLLAQMPENHVEIYVGDYLNKGGRTKEAVELMYDRVKEGAYVVIGNHESYVYRRLKGDIVHAPHEQEERLAFEAKYFSSLAVLEADEELRKKFFEIHEGALPFVHVQTPNSRSLFVTHAPCETKYLGKFSAAARHAQRNLHVKDREGDVRNEIEFVYKEAIGNKPLHIFGHLPHKGRNRMFKNKVFLDGGCVHGGELVAFVLRDGRYDFITSKGPEIEGWKNEALPDLTTQPKVDKPFDIRDYHELTPEDVRFVNGVVRHGVKYISGTMAPAPSWDGQLEPLKAALDFYHRRGITAVALQPKYMGSRCQFYLFRDEPEKSFAVSRNGYVIRRAEGIDIELQRHVEKCKDWYDGCWKSIVLDGELLPWSAIGKPLIERGFVSYSALVRHELTVLDGDEEFAKLDIAENYDTKGRLAELDVFDENLAKYAGDAPLEFKPFNILSCDGKIVGGNPYEIFEDASDDVGIWVSTETDDGLATAQAYFNTLTIDEKMEGIVVKPMWDQQEPLPEGVPEAMKVRNEGYLTLVYGYDYKRRYLKLVHQKNISNKVRISIKESQLAREMLTSTDDQMKQLTIQMIGQLKQEKTLDPRL
jgi:predicted kinase